jgi:hypothetical protein
MSFFPLANNRNKVTLNDRVDNSNYATDSNAKKNGFGIPNSDFWTDGTPGSTANNGTIVVQAWPGSDTFKTPFNDNKKWMLWCSVSNSLSAWWQFYVAGTNNTQIGNSSNYPTLISDSDGIRKGSFMISIRERSGGSGNNDGLVLINSGSIYQWDPNDADHKPFTIAIAYDHSDVWRASIDGVTVPAVHENRNGSNQGTNQWCNDIANSGGNKTTFLYDDKISGGAAGSGSFGETAYYTSSLTQDELNTITSQPWGSPTDVLSKRPQLLYRLHEDQKEQTTGATLTDQLNGKFAFPNLGNEDYSDTSLPQVKTIRDSSGSITSGSVLNAGVPIYQTRT